MTKPICPCFGECGGCSLQDVSYGEQLARKRKSLEEATGGKEIKVFPGREYGYRNRMDMIFHSCGIGFRKKGTWHTPVDVEKCAISNQKLNSIIKEVRDFFPEPDSFDLRKKTGTMRYAVIRTPGLSSSVSFVLNKESPGIADAMDRIREFSGQASADNVLVALVPPNTDVSVSTDFKIIKGSGFLKEKLLDKVFKFPVQGFFQNNTGMAEELHEHVRELLMEHDTKGAHLLDLYGGVGTFGIMNSGIFKGVTVVEGDAEAVECAMENIKENDTGNAKAMVLRDKDIRNLDLPRPLFVITDPPRAGMHPKALKWLRRESPDTIIYISCNPGQLKRDLEGLPEYKIKNVALFDFFPQTPHMEAVIELARKS